ncbi:MAG TPA: hypothetical protein GX733_04650 [Tissierellia bacterium]|nr:hypothetical protein [Tissierellia bacterium]
MDKLFLNILNMSLTGAFVIAVICLVRLFLQKFPKTISYWFWAVAGVRLVLPFSFEGLFSIIPFKAQTIPMDIALQPVPRIDSGITQINESINRLLPPATPTASINPLQTWIALAAFIWLIVAMGLLIYGVVTYFILRHKMTPARLVDGSIYESEHIQTAFVLGFIQPKIYLPKGLSEDEKTHVILHEQMHLQRRDPIVRLIAYVILCLHWFNPLVWLAYYLMISDMEMSCDERVLMEMGEEAKKEYSLSLLSLATHKRWISSSPLAFGEGGVKQRIKNVLRFKKPSRFAFLAVVLIVLLLSVGLFVHQRGSVDSFHDWEVYHISSEKEDLLSFTSSRPSYHPDDALISARLWNHKNVPGLICGTYYTLVIQDGEDWRIVPITGQLAFEDIAYSLDDGASVTYEIQTKDLSLSLPEGRYRIVTEVFHHQTEGQDPIKHAIWAEFTIDKNTPKLPH